MNNYSIGFKIYWITIINNFKNEIIKGNLQEQK
jgi:hypothetical protein